MKRWHEKIIYYLAVFVFLIFALGPIIWCFIISISPETEMFQESTRFLPEKPIADNYIKLLSFQSRQSEAFMNGLGNSLISVVITILIGLPIAVMAAYALSRLEFKGKRLIRTGLLITMVIPVFTTIIPLYTIFADFGILDNSFWLSVIYVTSFFPMVMWVLSNYFNTIPKELEEAALIDGCGRLRIFFDIILPNAYPIILAAILMLFLMTWSQYQIPLILASSRDTKPLSMIVAEFSSKDLIQYGTTAAAGILAILPPAFFAVIFRKYLVSGLTRGAVKE